VGLQGHGKIPKVGPRTTPGKQNLRNKKGGP
jgi:hypothetical protein